MSKPWDSLLPESVTVAGEEYAIRSDFRAMLDICAALSDPELEEQERGEVVLRIFYPELEKIPYTAYREAIAKCFWFLNGGTEERKNSPGPKLVDWEKDFPYIVSPINRVTGTEIRALPHLHWWTFLAAYYEIGDCLFAQIVRIRRLKAAGKLKDPQDKEWYRKNRDLVDMQTAYTEEEKAILSGWMV